jgi:hypothetical protein
VRLGFAAASSEGLYWARAGGYFSTGTSEFFVFWIALFILYAVAIRESGRIGRGGVAATFLGAASFRLTLLAGPTLGPVGGTEPAPLFKAPVELAVERGAGALAGRAGVEPLARFRERFEDAGFWRRSAAALADLGALAVLPGMLREAGHSPTAALVYGWNPLVVEEGAGRGRLDSLGLLFLGLSLGSLQKNGPRLFAAMAYGLSLGSRLDMAALIPLMARASGWSALISVTFGLGLWAVISVRSSAPPPTVETLLTNQGGGSLFPAANALATVFLTRNALYPSAACLGLWLVWAGYRALRPGLAPRDLPREALLALGSWLMVSPRVVPWDWARVALLSPFSMNRGWLVFTAAAPLGYLQWSAGESFWLAWLQYFPAYAVLVFLWLGAPPKKG